MKAIQVKFLGPTNTRGVRLKVIAEGVTALIASFDHAINSDQDRALYVATEFCIKNKWLKDTTNAKDGLAGGQLPNGDYVFCFKNQ